MVNIARTDRDRMDITRTWIGMVLAWYLIVTANHYHYQSLTLALASQERQGDETIYHPGGGPGGGRVNSCGLFVEDTLPELLYNK